MADHSKPLTTSTYANFVTELDARFDDLTVGIDPAVTTATNVPTNAIRWTSASNKWQKWNGTAWGDLSASYAINISGTAAGLSTALAATQGGTGQTSYAVGDLLFASTTTALSKLVDVATGNSLISGGVGVAPSWGKIGLTTHVSGTLPTANGGTNLASFTLNGAVYASSTSVLTTGTLPIASGGTNTTATPTNGGVVYGTGTALAYSALGTAGQALLSNGAAAPVWTSLTLENLPDSWVKRSCIAATTADLAAASATTNTITGTLVVFPAQDGVTLVVGNRLLVKNQTASAQNGIYTLTTLGVVGVTAWVLTRAADADTAAEIAGSSVNINTGTINGGLAYDNNFKSTDTLGTTAMAWAALGTVTSITAGTGLTGGTITGSGTIAIDSTVTTNSGTQTLTNKRITSRVGTTTSSATPTINTDNVDYYGLTAQAVDITSFTTNLTGTPTDGQKLWIYIVGTAARAITWGASFEASTAALPTTTVTTNRLDVGFVWNTATSKWRCVAVA